MRVFVLIATICVAASVTDEEYLPPLEGMQSLSLFYASPNDQMLIASYQDVPGFDFVRFTPNFAEILVTADKVEIFKTFLEANGIEYAVTVENLQEQVTEEHITQEVERRLEKELRNYFAYKGLSFTYYPKFDEIDEYLEYISSTYSNVATLINIGASYEGRQMKGLKLSTNGQKKPAVYIDGGIHAREWIAPATALYIIDQLVANQTNRNLLEKVDWYIFPLVNPDGYEFTHSKPTNRLWRKTRSARPGVTCRGVDGNRNYDMAWNTVGSSSNPCSDTYAGPVAFSEPETQNVRNFLLGMKGDIKMYITLHSYGQYILYPWGYTHELPDNEPELRYLADECAKAIASVRKTRYTFGTSANHLYPSSGGSDDWAMDAGGADLAYTYELPGGIAGFVLPPSEIKPVGTETFEAIKVIHRYVNSKYVSRY